MEENILQLRHIEKSFDKTPVLKDLSMDIGRGEFVTLLGPSGCGKTTALRIIAGLEAADSGEVVLNGKKVNDIAPDKRSVNTVFQNYALFPHMSVAQNIAYGPKIKGVAKKEIPAMVDAMLALVKMEGYGDRMPHQMSGGQRQRIAIARAIVNKPDILLLDEPLGALDLKLRRHMQSELKRIQRETGVTFIYVTHDQEEALDMSDHLAIMNNGELHQFGTPEEIYDRPHTRFVAEFVGERNILEVSDGRFMGFTVPGNVKEGFVAVHSDRMEISSVPFYENCLKGIVQEKQYAGSQTKIEVLVGETAVLKVVRYHGEKSFQKGDAVFLSWKEHDGVVLGAY